MRQQFEKFLAKSLKLNFADSDPVWSDYKRIIITGGVRAGKTTRGAFKAFKESLNPNVKLIWFVGPDYVQAREEFRMVFEWCTELGLIARDEETGKLKYSMPQDGQRTLTTVTGCRIETKSAKHPETLASVAPDGIVLCEPGQMPEEAYNACIGRLIQKRGWLWAVGTLENETNKPRYAWFEDKAVEWRRNPSTDQIAYSLPTWANTTIFPMGEADPVFVQAREELSSYLYARKYGGEPMGVDSPVFPWLWEDGAYKQFVLPCDAAEFVDGAIGVDYGRTFNHPSAVVVVQVDDLGRYWVRAGWQGYQVDLTEIESIVHGYEHSFKVHGGRVDPNQGILADALGYEVAAGGSTMGKPSEMRFSLANGLLETNSLFFEEGATGIDDVWRSMRLCARFPNSRGELIYNRPIGDDLAQALMYAIEHLRGDYLFTPNFDNGAVSMGRYYAADGNRGRI